MSNESADRVRNEQVDAIVVALRKELDLILPKDRMDHIEDICRDVDFNRKRKVK